MRSCDQIENFVQAYLSSGPWGGEEGYRWKGGEAGGGRGGGEIGTEVLICIFYFACIPLFSCFFLILGNLFLLFRAAVGPIERRVLVVEIISLTLYGPKALSIPGVHTSLVPCLKKIYLKSLCNTQENTHPTVRRASKTSFSETRGGGEYTTETAALRPSPSRFFFHSHLAPRSEPPPRCLEESIMESFYLARSTVFVYMHARLGGWVYFFGFIATERKKESYSCTCNVTPRRPHILEN